MRLCQCFNKQDVLQKPKSKHKDGERGYYCVAVAAAQHLNGNAALLHAPAICNSHAGDAII
jgi:hypothetical protein